MCVGGYLFKLSTQFKEDRMALDHYEKVLLYLRCVHNLNLRPHIAFGHELPLLDTAFYFDYIIVSQRRYYASNRTNNTANSIVVVQSPASSEVRIGELTDILILKQVHLGGIYHLGHVRWLIPASIPLAECTNWPPMWVRQ